MDPSHTTSNSGAKKAKNETISLLDWIHMNSSFCREFRQNRFKHASYLENLGNTFTDIDTQI